MWLRDQGKYGFTTFALVHVEVTSGLCLTLLCSVSEIKGTRLSLSMMMTFLWRWRVLQPFSWSHSFQKTCLLAPYTPLFFIFFVTMVISLAQTLNSSHLVSHHKRVLICLLRWLSGKEPNCQCRRWRFDPWVREIPWRRKWQHTPVFLPGKSHGQRSLAGCSPWSHKESDTM